MKKLIISVLCIIVLNNSISVLASMDLALMEKTQFLRSSRKEKICQAVMRLINYMKGCF